ncbi:rod-determining factor RdfA [Haloarcula sediminis]|uniref:rod-determining factor RdfA n=1 Tax=Haloarcula sediminis TaxID=3111777 RepID=UPI002D772440|nr:rod-determining factor RdfA [Haloarcula sp. CK38]
MSSDTRSKVARLIDAYELAPIGDELETAWLGEAGERQSLRDLADRFNRALLLSGIRDAGMDVVDGEARNYYRLLTDEDVSAGPRVEAENRLDAAGIDVDALVENFVTYQAIRHYLTEVRGASYEREERDGVDRERSVIDRLQGRVERVVRDTVDRLAKAGRLTVGDYRLFVSVDVRCEDCGGQYTVDELLDRGHCDCD